jgi:hypothetical protein
MNHDKHLDHFLTICDIHGVVHDDVMVRVFMQTLIGPAYDWYLSLPENLITCFDDIEYAFMGRYAHHVAYHTLLTQFTQIHLEKNEKIRDFNLQFFRTCNEYQKINVLMTLSFWDVSKMQCLPM